MITIVIQMATNEVTYQYMYITFATTVFVSLTFCRPGNFTRQIILYPFFIL